MKDTQTRVSDAVNASELDSAQLQKLTGRSRPAVADRLSGRTRWSLDDVVKIARKLGITLDELLTGKAPATPDEQLAPVVELTPPRLEDVATNLASAAEHDDAIDQLLGAWVELDTRSQLRCRRDYPALVAAVERLHNGED